MERQVGVKVKREGWESRLAQFAAARLGRPFCWGADDCCLLAADWVAVAIGADPVADLRGYATELGAARKLKRFTGGETSILSAADLIAADIGASEVQLARAQRGDVVAFRDDGRFGAALGVCLGSTALTFHEGYVRAVPMAAALRAWRL